MKLHYPLFAAMLLMLSPQAAFADPPARTVTMSGMGIAKAAPDRATFSTGVVSEGKTASAALAANSRAMNAVFATLEKLGIPKRAVQTSDFSLEPVYQEVKVANTTVQRLIGYRVTNTVTVAIDDIAKIGEVLDALVASGSNRAGEIAFSLKDPEPLLAKAREAAAKDAIARAETYARATGVTLGPIQSIQENGGEPPRPLYRSMDKMAFGNAAPTPVAGGEEDISASVTIVWIIQ
jgi:uncharacterized protein